MRIIVDKLPERSGKCLFRKYYNEKFDRWTCGFSEATVCSLEFKGKCPYLCSMEEYERE